MTADKDSMPKNEPFRRCAGSLQKIERYIIAAGRWRGEHLMNAIDIGARVQNIGTGMLRYGLVAILVMLGATKWTPAETEAIRPWVTNSPFLSWIYSVISIQAGSEIIGAIEILAALLIGERIIRHAVSEPSA